MCRGGDICFAVSEPPALDGKDPARGWLYVNVTETIETTNPLTAADRCDRCGAQAYVRVQLPVGELLFCAHHAREHAPKYSALATHVQDETDRLLAEHGAGAGAAR
jgi:hypothetical protein